VLKKDRKRDKKGVTTPGRRDIKKKSSPDRARAIRAREGSRPFVPAKHLWKHLAQRKEGGPRDAQLGEKTRGLGRGKTIWKRKRTSSRSGGDFQSNAASATARTERREANYNLAGKAGPERAS